MPLTDYPIGVTSPLARSVYREVWEVRSAGFSARELAGWMRISDGQASAALSRLHSTGDLTRLALRRKGGRVYVHPHFVHGRETTPYTPRHTPQPAPRPALLLDPQQNEKIAALLEGHAKLASMSPRGIHPDVSMGYGRSQHAAALRLAATLVRKGDFYEQQSDVNARLEVAQRRDGAL